VLTHEGMQVAWALTALFVALLVFAEAKGLVLLKRVSKPLASIGFVATAILAGAAETTVGIWVLIALVLGLIGDVLLLGQSKPMFLGGLVVFLLGHLGFVAAFVARGIAPYQILVGAVAMVFFGSIAWRWLAPHVGSMKIPVIAYMIVISSMVTFAFASCRAFGNWIVFVGVVIFYLSDLCVARERFVIKSFTNKLFGLPLYYAGQILLASYLR
jgi:uncharacterized membrane protein YhhN